jgi:hypothetical protein
MGILLKSGAFPDAVSSFTSFVGKTTVRYSGEWEGDKAEQARRPAIDTIYQSFREEKRRVEALQGFAVSKLFVF